MEKKDYALLPDIPKTAEDVKEWDVPIREQCFGFQEHIELLRTNIDTICRNNDSSKHNTNKLCAMYMWLREDLYEALQLGTQLCHRLYLSLTYDCYDELKDSQKIYEAAMAKFNNLSLNKGDNLRMYIDALVEKRQWKEMDMHQKELLEYQEEIRLTAERITVLFSYMFNVNSNRCNEWQNIIYKAYEQKYMQDVLPDKWTAYKRKNLKQRFKYKDVKATDLIQVREELYNALNGTDLGRIWLEHNDEDEMAFMMARENLDSDDFDTFFKLLGLYNNMGEWIEEQRERESNGDPVFRVWVDVTALENSLQYWVNGQMQKGKGKNQQHWMVFWCVMNELQMIRPEVKPKEFYERISQMFPHMEIPCQYESVRKLLTRDHHDKPIDKWEKTDPFQTLATELRDKIKSIWDKIKNSNLRDLE